MKRTIAVSGLVNPYSGIGVIQRELYPRLEADGVQLVAIPSRQPKGGRISRLNSTASALLTVPASQIDTFLSVVPPLPLGPLPRTVAFVHDLRWQRTRSLIGRRYRSWDLRRTVARASDLVAVSRKTAVDLAEFNSAAAAKTHICRLGPGQAQTIEAKERHRGSDVIVVGRGDHKRNDLAVEVLKCMPPGWFDRLITVGVDPSIIDRCVGWWGQERLENYEMVSPQELMDLFGRSKYSLQLGVEEGFGMPYVESLVNGCVVVAIRQALTEEVLGDAAILLPDSSPVDLAGALLSAESPSGACMESVAIRYSWDKFADEVLEVVGKS